jgi:hypothetical protein
MMKKNKKYMTFNNKTFLVEDKMSMMPKLKWCNQWGRRKKSQVLTMVKGFHREFSQDKEGKHFLKITNHTLVGQVYGALLIAEAAVQWCVDIIQIQT